MKFFFRNTVYQLQFKGSDAMDRGDAYYSISNLDYPVSALMQSPNKISKGTVKLIGLTLKEVCLVPTYKRYTYRHMYYLCVIPYGSVHLLIALSKGI